MDPNNPELMKAIDAGIADASPTPPPAPIKGEGAGDENVDQTPTGDLPDGSDPAAGAGDGGAEGGTAGAGGDGKPDGEGEPTTPAEGDPEGGKPDAKDGAPKPGERKPGEAPKQPDDLNDPLPNALKKDTKERIHRLVDRVKSAEERGQQSEQRLSTIVQRIQDTGATPEQYGQTLQYLTLVNSGDRNLILKALEFVKGEVVALSRMAGVPAPGVSFLEEHEDLMAEVHAGKLTRERAEEIAASRSGQQYAQNMQAHRARQQNDATAYQQEVRSAQDALNAREAELKAADPAYMQKRQVILSIVLPLIRSGAIAPKNWVAEFDRIYKTLPAAVRTAAPPGTPPAGVPAGAAAAARAPGNQPLRAAQPAGSARPVPKTLADAIDLGIEEARR